MSRDAAPLSADRPTLSRTGSSRSARSQWRSSQWRISQWQGKALLSALLCVPLSVLLSATGGIQRAAAQSASAQSASAQSIAEPIPQRLSGAVALGPRLLEYRIECLDSSKCRVQCYQHGVKIIDRTGINAKDRLSMLASTSANDEIIPRWLEIRSADGAQAQTLLLSLDTSCDLTSLTISPGTPQ